MLFLTGVGSLMLEPLLARLDEKYEEYKIIGSLGLLILTVISFIAGIPCVLLELKWPLSASLIILGLLAIRLMLQFWLDKKDLKKLRPGYLIQFGLGLFVLSDMVYLFVGMAIFNAQVVNC